MPTRAQIVSHEDPLPGFDPWVDGAHPEPVMALVEPDPQWPAVYAAEEQRLRAALGARALSLQHVGSTSVPGLAAKPIIDIDLVVADPSDEDAYVVPLTPLAYQLWIREPHWYEHRLLRGGAPRVNLHVFGPEAPEPLRHAIFRDWLRAHPEDRDSYADAKRDALPGGGHTEDYNLRKQPVIRAIYDRAFAAAGLR